MTTGRQVVSIDLEGSALPSSDAVNQAVQCIIDQKKQEGFLGPMTRKVRFPPASTEGKDSKTSVIRECLVMSKFIPRHFDQREERMIPERFSYFAIDGDQGFHVMPDRLV